MSTELLDAQRDAHKSARDGLSIISDMALGFRLAGMHDVSKKLSIAIEYLDDGVTGMDKAFSRQIHERFVASQEASNNMIRAALAANGVDIGDEDILTDPLENGDA